ncbi:hypothetical protein AB0D37_43030 [Streptomyces sp. NPDC048384]|uniref:hypothetical protein n=1 Tax=Streptomyces sp. NPDC048384 TaxID=3155487 RepID=UPI003443A8FC
MASQVITLVGVLLGAMTSFFATSLAERAKFRQTLATRWDERKLNTYIEYISSVKEANRAARQALEAHERGEDAADLLAEMEAAEARRSVLFEGLMLLGDQAATETAAVVNDRLWALLRSARNPAGASTGVRQQLSLSIIEALCDLQVAARSDLAIGKSLRAGRRTDGVI